jgi:xylulose-5-phosphate/fructose-6-phosphate phosphoketolase
MSDADFIDIFTATTPVVFAFHGYPGVIHDLLHGRDAHERFHIRGYIEEGTTTTPFDMVVLNRMSRLHLCLDALRYAAGDIAQGASLIGYCTDLLAEHEIYIREHFEDLPEITNWFWSA